MHLSRYVLVCRDVRRGEHVLYDVVSDRYVGVDDAGISALERWRVAGPAQGQESEAAAELRELGFLVSGPEEDEARLRASERTAAGGRQDTVYVTLMPTLACDLACTYCFQKDHPAQGHMTAEVEAASLDWIARTVRRSGASHLALVYLGGEPLTRKDFVLRTARSLAAALPGVTLDWQIITNGIALDLPFARSMATLGRGVIKVTLDGDRETHDAARVYRDGRPTFDRIFRAMASVARECPEVRVRVGGNFRGGDERSFEKLLDRMVAEGLAGRIESVSFKPVIEGGCTTACGPRGAESLVQLGRAIEARGIARVASQGVDEVAPCELHWDNAWTIDPAGRLYKCLAVAGRPELAIGDVRRAETRPDPLTAGRPWAQGCSPDCPFVPVCLGGCMGGRVATGGRPGELACDRGALERLFREEIARRYLDEFKTAAPAPERPEAVTVAA